MRLNRFKLCTKTSFLNNTLLLCFSERFARSPVTSSLIIWHLRHWMERYQYIFDIERFAVTFSRRRSEHTDRNVELKLTVLFRTTPNSFRDSHYMVLPQTFLYRISTMQSLKSYLIYIWFCGKHHVYTYLFIILFYFFWQNNIITIRGRPGWGKSIK